MDTLDHLQAIEEIRQLKARYFWLIDTKQWDEFATLFAPDMVVEGEDGSIWLRGGQAFADSIRNSLDRSVSIHHGFAPVIEILDEQNAKAIWPMEDIIEWEDRHPREGWTSILGRGHYHETYRRIDGAWRIASLKLVRLKLDVTT